MTKLYYAYHVAQRKDELWLEFHTGSDKEEVRQGKSFNHGLKVYSNSTDRGLRFPLKEVFENWETQIDMFNMERAYIEDQAVSRLGAQGTGDEFLDASPTVKAALTSVLAKAEDDS